LANFKLKGHYHQGECVLVFKVISSIKEKANPHLEETGLNNYFIEIHSQLEIDRYHKFIEKYISHYLTKNYKKYF